MDIKPLRSRKDYNAALADVDALMTARRGSHEGEKLDVLVTLIEAYERQHFPLDLPDAVETFCVGRLGPRVNAHRAKP